jgi:uncharacterized protein (DUF1499 family)
MIVASQGKILVRLYLNTQTETGVLDSSPKLLGFHISDLATCPNMPNIKDSKGQRKRFITTAWTSCGKRQSKSSAIFGI